MILLTYNLRKNTNKIQKFIDSINYRDKVFVYIFDLRPNKEKPEFSEREGVNVEYLKIAMEDSNKTFDITYSLALQLGIKCYSNIEEHVIFNKSLDLVLTQEAFENDNISIIFSDFEFQVENSCKSRTLILFKEFPADGRLPLIFVKTYGQELIAKAVENKMSYIEFLSKMFVVKHVPEPICYVTNE